MARYEITLKDRTVEVIDGADAYQQEGQMTTFFALGGERRVVDCWSTRLASFRTIGDHDHPPATASEPSSGPGADRQGQGTYAPSQAIDDSATTAAAQHRHRRPLDLRRPHAPPPGPAPAGRRSSRSARSS